MGRGKAQHNLDLIQTSYEILERIQPASTRAVCYQLFNRKLIANTGKNCTNRVSVQLTWAREQGRIPWEWIVDETREPEYAATWDNPEQLIQSTVNQYRKDRWQHQPHPVEVWSEKGTVRGTLAPVLEEYGVTFRVTHGYTSATAIHQAAVESLSRRAPLQVFYVGDWDPSGMHMSEVDLPTRLREYGANIHIERVALNHADVSLGGLPSFDAETKRSDARWGWFTARYGTQCWELDALSPILLRQRVEAAIQSTIDWPQWEQSAHAEVAEQESMQDILALWQRARGA